MSWKKPGDCNDGACLEVWQRPCESAHCLESRHDGDMVLLRASGEPDTVVKLTPQEMSAFVQAAKDGEYDGYVS